MYNWTVTPMLAYLHTYGGHQFALIHELDISDSYYAHGVED